ncbi:MAG: ABC transporter ATP-binding protein, partial [Pseudomonadota bacterium]|nr:ABC transporter ATP-binding protein [Pseudomonadota bacterium]
KILAKLDEHCKNITTITIAHRLSTITNAKRIVFLQKGSISSTGTHYQLMKKNLDYKKHFITNLK